MFAFRMSIAAAAEFYRRAGLLEVDNAENRNKLLLQMVKEGLTNVKKPGFDSEDPIDAVWCQDSTTGERVLLDRKTNQVIMREGDRD